MTIQRDQRSDPKASWVNDDCQNGSIFPISRRRAQGIRKIHATCDPPCPRAESARSYLEGGQAQCPRT
ncbi:hypothetical protein ACFV4K_18130 [Nocardia sp. NPDC059764]|uniref:hypothetical protein n=1 Tax=Nocardia sp. NPDC059764 TaxID=3346939 RepID=UPI0036491E5A